MHISLEKCTSIDASHSTITTPNESPNIDGIHVAHSKRIKIANSFIGSDKFYVWFKCVRNLQRLLLESLFIVYDAIDEILIFV